MGSMTYGAIPGGYQLTTSGPGLPAAAAGGAGGANDLLPFFLEMARRKQMAEQQAVRAAPGRQKLADQEARTRSAYFSGGAPGESYVSTPQAVETPWYTHQGAATRPVGLSPGMVPGMMADPNLLPPQMRPEAAHFVGARSRVPTGTVDSPDMDFAADSVQNTNLPPNPYERIRRQALNAGYGR